jgi:hypothetical protein
MCLIMLRRCPGTRQGRAWLAVSCRMHDDTQRGHGEAWRGHDIVRRGYTSHDIVSCPGTRQGIRTHDSAQRGTTSRTTSCGGGMRRTTSCRVTGQGREGGGRSHARRCAEGHEAGNSAARGWRRRFARMTRGTSCATSPVSQNPVGKGVAGGIVLHAR